MAGDIEGVAETQAQQESKAAVNSNGNGSESPKSKIITLTTPSSNSSNLLHKRKYDDDVLSKANGSGYNATWRNAKMQKTFGYEPRRFEPTKTITQTPKQIEFELEGSRPLSFGPQTRFFVKMAIQKRASAQGSRWNEIESNDFTKVLLAPNFFEKIIASYDLFLGNHRINAHDEHGLIAPEFNSFLYWFMSPHTKKILFPQDMKHPCVITNTEAYNEKDSNYAAIVEECLFDPTGFSFHYVPFHVFPFCQTPNFYLDCPQSNLPVQQTGKIYFRINLRENYSDYVLKKVNSNDEHSYRLAFKDIVLLAEEDRMSPATAKIPRNQLFEYKGITRDCRIVQGVKEGDPLFRIKFLENALPEQLIIFALHKDVVAGTYKFQTHEPGESFFIPTNIKEVITSYNNNTFSTKEPHFASFSDSSATLRYMDTVLKNGIAGVMVNTDKVTYDHASKEYADSLYPHILIDYTLEGTRDRIQPSGTDGAALKKDGALDFTIRFGEKGAASNAVYIAYLIYTDYSLVYDFKANKFTRYYQSTVAI